MGHKFSTRHARQAKAQEPPTPRIHRIDESADQKQHQGEDQQNQRTHGGYSFTRRSRYHRAPRATTVSPEHTRKIVSNIRAHLFTFQGYSSTEQSHVSICTTTSTRCEKKY